MTEDIPELSDRQKELLDALPASKQELADELHIAESTVKGHVKAVREKEIDIGYDRSAGQYYIDDERASKLRRVSTKHKASKTREATDVSSS